MVVWKSRKAGGFSSCLSTLPGRSRQVLSAPFGKLRRFCPIYDFSSVNSAASRSCLQADTGVIRLQPYLRQTSLNFPKWEMLSFVQHFTVTEVKLVFSHIACSPEAIWEEMHNKKAPHTRCLSYSAIQLPAAISIWESSGFHSSVVCGSQRQYFVFAPHQAFVFSLCILYLFLAI